MITIFCVNHFYDIFDRFFDKLFSATAGIPRTNLVPASPSFWKLKQQKIVAILCRILLKRRFPTMRRSACCSMRSRCWMRSA